ncbi:hypothetical protein CMI37_35995 [Candidatus Pacearchaeota archaeon]|nr:hypothetical protein [Candidatus Pacearchaeota archaeon]|tara:strand:- start:1546 stop:2367 length:822 start_codon:yes stop_codon:yes gene_type:complete
MIDRQEFAEELLLRENIRKAIKIVKNSRTKRRLNEQKQETELRAIIQDLLNEAQTAVATTAKHASTGINTLEDLLRNSNILSVLEMGYKSLTTDKIQRESYRNHVLVAVEKVLAPEESRKEAGEEIVTALEEDVNIDIDRPEDDPDFIDVDEEEVEKSDGEIEKEDFALAGEDKTGRNKAFTDFQTIEKVILRAFDDLDNPEDRGLFSEYLIKNLALYFDKYESDLDTNVEEPAVAAAAEPTLEPGEEEEIANIELQELIKHLNIDDIVENLV